MHTLSLLPNTMSLITHRDAAIEDLNMPHLTEELLDVELESLVSFHLPELQWGPVLSPSHCVLNALAASRALTASL